MWVNVVAKFIAKRCWVSYLYDLWPLSSVVADLVNFNLNYTAYTPHCHPSPTLPISIFIPPLSPLHRPYINKMPG